MELTASRGGRYSQIKLTAVVRRAAPQMSPTGERRNNERRRVNSPPVQPDGTARA